MSGGMAIDAEKLLDPQTMRDGPFEVLWNQDEWIEPSGPLDHGEQWPVRKPLQVILGHRRWRGVIRLAPPPGEDLMAWGTAAAEQLGIPWRAPGDGVPPRGVWIPFTTWARDAGGAIGSAGVGIRRLKGFKVAQVQIRVWRP